MSVGLTIAILVVVSIIIYIFFELKRYQHKLLAVFLIFLILFLYFSFIFVFKDDDINFGSVDGIQKASGIYLSWLGTVFGNFKVLTGNAVGLNWKTNTTTSTRK